MPDSGAVKPKKESYIIILKLNKKCALFMALS